MPISSFLENYWSILQLLFVRAQGSHVVIILFRSSTISPVANFKIGKCSLSLLFQFSFPNQITLLMSVGHNKENIKTKNIGTVKHLLTISIFSKYVLFSQCAKKKLSFPWVRKRKASFFVHFMID